MSFSVYVSAGAGDERTLDKLSATKSEVEGKIAARYIRYKGGGRRSDGMRFCSFFSTNLDPSNKQRN